MDAEGVGLQADLAEEEVGTRAQAEDEGHPFGLLGLLDADIVEAAEAPEVADVLADGGGVEGPAHLCREVHGKGGAGGGDGGDHGGGPSDKNYKEEDEREA